MGNYPIEVSPTIAVILPILTFYYRMAYTDRILRFLFLYLVIKLGLDLVMWYMAAHRMPNLYLENTEMIVRYFLLARMYFEVFSGRKFKLWVILSSIAYILVASIDIYRKGFYVSLPFVGVAECIIMISLVFCYWHELITYLKFKALLDSPFFYVSCAILLFYCGNLFLAPMSPTLNKHPYNVQMQALIIIPYIFETASFVVFGLGIFARE